MAIEFSEAVRHGGFEFLPGIAYAFEGERVEEYFTSAGWAKKSSKSPARTFEAAEVSIDPATVFASGEKAGQRVLGEEA